MSTESYVMSSTSPIALSSEKEISEEFPESVPQGPTVVPTFSNGPMIKKASFPELETGNNEIWKDLVILTNEDAIALMTSRLIYFIAPGYIINTVERFKKHDSSLGLSPNDWIFATYIILCLKKKIPSIFEHDCCNTTRLVISTALLIAVKMTNDIPWSNSYWSRVCHINMQTLNKAESDIFFNYDIDFDPTVEKIKKIIGNCE